MPKRAGRPSVAQTPAPKSDKIYGSKKNPSGSATEKKSKSIKLSDKTIDTLKEKLDNFKKSHPNKKSVDLNDLKAVYRRGSGAYSKSHRPTITGGAPNSRAAWSYARVNKFLKKAGGAKVKAAYVQDDDLMAKGGKVYNDKELLAKYKQGESIGFTGEAHLKAKGLIPRADGTKRKSAKYMADGGKLDETQIFILEHPEGMATHFAKGAKIPKRGDCYEAAGQFCMGSVFMPEPIEFVGEPHLVHAEVKGQGKAEGIRFGHAWVEDDENVYDYSNGRRIVMPKVVYYAIGDIRTENPEKYQKYTFPEARAKMLETKHYGSWDIKTEYADGGELSKDLQDFLDMEFYSDTKFSDVSKSCDLSKGNCYDVSEELMDYLKDKGYKNMSLVEVRNPLFNFSEAHDEWKKMPKEKLFHIILKVDDKFIDLTGIQFSKEQEGIKIYDENELSSLWGKKEYFVDGGMPSQHITCINCGWEWETADSAESDKYVCHQCGFDNTLFYDGGLLKPTMPLDQIAEKHGVSLEYLEEELNKGMQHEKEHTNSDEVATTIALHHLAERPDYYEELEKIELEDGGEVDLFEDIDSLPENVQAVLAKYSGADESYTNAEAMLAELEPLGYTFEYGLDALPFNLRKTIISEDNSYEEYEIQDFLKQQKEEAHMVMTCDDSKIYKAMICKTKCEIADKRMSETENPEELNAWLHYKNIWSDCMQDILDNNMEMYKVGGKTCGCGCGSIYSKGGLAFSKGGLAYGNSHDKGGMPMKVQSTGQNIEIEGGEGVINKRSMQSTKKIEFQGQKMTPCEAVSKINEMGGGVKFKCADVKNIIEEDGHF